MAALQRDERDDDELRVRRSETGRVRRGRGDGHDEVRVSSAQRRGREALRLARVRQHAAHRPRGVRRGHSSRVGRAGELYISPGEGDRDQRVRGRRRRERLHGVDAFARGGRVEVQRRRRAPGDFARDDGGQVRGRRVPGRGGARGLPRGFISSHGRARVHIVQSARGQSAHATVADASVRDPRPAPVRGVRRRRAWCLRRRVVQGIRR
mmetsp:Transcript_1160/g.3850  ORF Transcript_1160/g.3850 Transcript_1160/m.3850 type:complete len:209 (+) Transcript_1160:471-1097(+)